MTIDIDATYRDGAIHPDTPLNLPNNTPIRVRVLSTAGSKPPTNDDNVVPPKSPRITSEEFRERIAKYAVRVGTLPPDFSREDIYSDHD
jgi:hypothetical protein